MAWERILMRIAFFSENIAFQAQSSFDTSTNKKCYFSFAVFYMFSAFLCF